MVNTILTDDEIVAINEQHYNIAFRNFESDVAIARAIETAVLAKLRGQEPVAVVRSNGIEIRGEYSELIGSNLYAYRVPSDAELYSSDFGFEGCYVFSAANRTNTAPQPAVVPPGYKLVPVEPTEKMIRAVCNCNDIDHIGEITQNLRDAIAAA